MNRKSDLRALVVLLLALLLGLIVPDARRASAMIPDDILTMQAVGIADLDATGERLLFTRRVWDDGAGRRLTSLYARNLEQGRELLLLGPEDGGHGAGWLPHGQAVSYLKSGDEGTEIWLMDPDGGQRRRLGTLAGNVGPLHWAPDASAVAWITPGPDGPYAGNPDRWIVADDPGYRHLGEGYREGRLRQIQVYEVGSDSLITLPTPGLDVRGLSWSPDGSSLVFCAKRRQDLNRSLNTDLWRLQRSGEDLIQLTTNPGGDDQPLWLDDGRIAYLRATDPLWESAPRTVSLLDPSAGEAGGLESLGGRFDNMIRGFAVVGGRIFVRAASRGCLEVFELQGEQALPVTRGGHDFWSLDGGGQRLVMAGAGQTLPGALFTVNPGPTGAPAVDPTIILDPNREWRQRVGLIDPERFTVTVEGRAIEGWYYRPPDHEDDGAAPLVLSIHGGPEWMYGGYFLPEFHILPTYGYGVLIANPTGSSGYGFEFQNGVRGDWSGRPARELLACVDHAVASGWADSTALAVMGGSYGGHLTVDLTTQTDRFKAAAADRMFPDLEAFWGTTDEKWFPEWEFHGRPWEPGAREYYRRNSPTTRVARVRTPTLISQGMLDYRCLIAGGEIWFSSLQALGVPSRFIRFLHEGHGIRDPRDQVFYQEQLLEFFDRHVLGLGVEDPAEAVTATDAVVDFPGNE